MSPALIQLILQALGLVLNKVGAEPPVLKAFEGLVEESHKAGLVSTALKASLSKPEAKASAD